MANLPVTKVGRVRGDRGMVMIDGPGPVAATLTSQAADAMGRKLIEEAKRAGIKPQDNE